MEEGKNDMKVLIINAGSSSLKYQLLDMENEVVMVSGMIERIGETIGTLSYKKFTDDGTEDKTVLEREIKDHSVGLRLVIKMITDAENGVIKHTNEIDAIGHRVVQGAEAFRKSVIIDTLVKNAIKENNILAPLHNPANLIGIEVAEELFPKTPNIAVFDTEFHHTMPAKAFLYALPYRYYTDLRIRRYGFHGTSHKFVSKKVASLMGKKPEEINVITVHIGNGCSIAGIKKGKSIDTSMGMTPLAGLIMGTRCGDIDPAISDYIAQEKKITPEQVDMILNKESGLKGICGMNDMRDIHASAKKGDEKAILAQDMFAYNIKKYIGAYSFALGNVDAIVFTAGIGENDPIVREDVCKELSNFGIEIDLEKNKNCIGYEKKISKDKSKIDIWVIPTNEELQIAHDTVEVVNKI